MQNTFPPQINIQGGPQLNLWIGIDKGIMRRKKLDTSL